MSREIDKENQDTPRFTSKTIPSELIFEYGTIVGVTGNAGSRQELISQLNREATADGQVVINIEETILDDGQMLITGMSVPSAIQ